MRAAVLDATGASRTLEMGCYGIGITRVVAAAIEQHHDERGIALPAALAPFEACLVPIAYAKNEKVRAAADALYAELCAAGIDALMDDREERPGVLFADLDLIGVPHRVVLSERGLAAGEAEYKGRRDAQARNVPLAGLTAFLKERLAQA
jgi:prolyl-tRNA synthetase